MTFRPPLPTFCDDAMRERVAVIPGGARGIGRAIALRLARDGWAVAIAYRTSQAAADATVTELWDIHGTSNRSRAFQCDVSDPQTAEALAKQVEGEWARIDALINCAGPYHRVPLLEETIEGWHSMFDNNLHPVFYLSRAVAPGMKARKWGRIINFSMANADQMAAQPQVTAHYIAKAGILILTRSLARVLGPHGITVNAVSPGFINSGSAPPEELAAMEKRIPAGYVGTVDDAVGAVSFLLSDDARYVNGANIQVSGGWGL